MIPAGSDGGEKVGVCIGEVGSDEVLGMLVIGKQGEYTQKDKTPGVRCAVRETCKLRSETLI